MPNRIRHLPLPFAASLLVAFSRLFLVLLGVLFLFACCLASWWAVMCELMSFTAVPVYRPPPWEVRRGGCDPPVDALSIARQRGQTLAWPCRSRGTLRTHTGHVDIFDSHPTIDPCEVYTSNDLYWRHDYRSRTLILHSCGFFKLETTTLTVWFLLTITHNFFVNKNTSFSIPTTVRCVCILHLHV